MSLYDYHLSLALEKQETPFYALIMAAMRQADTPNVEKLRDYWPEVWFELEARYHAPGGRIPADYEKRKEERRDSELNGLHILDEIDRRSVTCGDRRK